MTTAPETAAARTLATGTARYLEIDGRVAYVETYGSGTPVLCVHSAGQSGVQWRDTVGGLAERGWQAVVVDLPGHGRSELPAAGPVTDLGVYARWCVDVVHALELRRPRVVGCSIGGKIALDVAARLGAEASGLVAMAADARNRGQNERALRRSLADAVSPSRSDRTYLGTIAACGSAVPMARRRLIAEMHRREDPQVSLSDLIGWARHDLRDRLSAITCPARLVIGADDFWLADSTAEATAAAIPDCALTVLEGIGHYPMEEIPGFAAVLDAWLRAQNT
ncbi:alpha/beta fold hydrolase [Amycolatopsis endophytica]|uniref:Pimeloyl-ACP methyl ester carboxylesterase n=1 Tax=Amycolatopsis endophytica TaxID=860233 RepID=A0A853BBJ0_9PSEU|nr:alpha/beta hydrolase [Amycolatopsis endophytica]NYI92380.1 pimeloyl-ACP methyl ester carboxylesterase [Amycolatopsis endophytica]